MAAKTIALVSVVMQNGEVVVTDTDFVIARRSRGRNLSFLLKGRNLAAAAAMPKEGKEGRKEAAWG